MGPALFIFKRGATGPRDLRRKTGNGNALRIQWDFREGCVGGRFSVVFFRFIVLRSLAIHKSFQGRFLISYESADALRGLFF